MCTVREVKACMSALNLTTVLSKFCDKIVVVVFFYVNTSFGNLCFVPCVCAALKCLKP